MIIVQGVFQLEPTDREGFIAESVENQRISRAEPGCLEYVVAADPIDPKRVVLSERWATRADLDAHIEALMARRAAATATGATPIAPLSRDVTFFEAAEFTVM